MEKLNELDKIVTELLAVSVHLVALADRLDAGPRDADDITKKAAARQIRFLCNALDVATGKANDAALSERIGR